MSAWAAGGLVGGGVGEQLDLVELVHPEKTPGVASGRPGLAPEAGGRRRELHGQGILVEDLVAVHRGERCLGGGDGPQVVALEVVGVVGELGELAGGHHGVGAHQGGRADLLEGVGVVVEGEGGEGPQEPGPCPPVEREHRSGELGPALHVEDAEGGAHLPVGDPLVLGVGPAVLGPAPDGEVVLGAGAVGGVVGREVGQPQKTVAHLGLAGLGLGTEGRLLVASRPALVGQAGGGGVVVGPLGLGHLTGQVLHRGPQVVAPAHGVAGPGVGGQ